MAKSKSVAEFGDFQTPPALASEVTALLKSLRVLPSLIVEPTCGRGAFLLAAAEHFPNARLLGLDINSSYLDEARSRLGDAQAELVHESFFNFDWATKLNEQEGPLLVLGNPPWVTNSELGSLGSSNLPTKSNFQNHRGFDAVTGKANFDISEWMLLQNVLWLSNRPGAIAVLCKTAVARKVLRSIWRAKTIVSDARIYKIDALGHFGAAVDACLFVLQFGGEPSTTCAVFETLQSVEPTQRFGLADGHIVSDIDQYQKWRHLSGTKSAFTWRSGVKHDCSKVMELELTETGLVNGYGQAVDIEETFVFPLMKSSDIAGARKRDRKRFVIVTQRTIGEDTRGIEIAAPRTWAYLQANSAALDARTSIIYRNKPQFSIFGVGPYTFAPWKVAISGLYKRFAFKLFGPADGRPMMFDDTVYFLPFESEADAQFVLSLLQTEEALGFLESQVFWDDKRPITVDLLKRLNISTLADANTELGALPEASLPEQRRLFA